MPVDQHTSHHISRLKSRPEYLRVARGRRFAAPGLVLQAKKRPAEELVVGVESADTPEASQADEAAQVQIDQVRVGFTATKKTGNAVRRNRIRRRLKVAAEQIMPAQAKPGFDYVIVGRAATFERPWQSLLDDLGLALQMVHQPRSQRGSKRRESPKP